jgi:hypothetical protein
LRGALSVYQTPSPTLRGEFTKIQRVRQCKRMPLNLNPILEPAQLMDAIKHKATCHGCI